MAIVDMAQQQRREGPCNLFIFINGSARKISCKLTLAGWGFTVMENYGKGNRPPIVSACGPIQTNEDGELWVGATRATNNTAEM